jgi:hypothetical protein
MLIVLQRQKLNAMLLACGRKYQRRKLSSSKQWQQYTRIIRQP